MKSLYEQMGGPYHWEGDYLIPDLVLLEEDRPISIWGQRHLRYIKQERKLLYTELLTSGRLNAYLADINAQAEGRMLLLTEQMARREGITEALKATDQMEWVRRMNSIRAKAEEIVLRELVYC